MFVDPQKARQERERQERERLARIEAEKKRQEKIKAEKERQAKLKEEQKRLAKLREEKKQQAKLKEEQKDADKKPASAKKKDSKLDNKQPIDQKPENKKSQSDKKSDPADNSGSTSSKPGQTNPIYGPSSPTYSSLSFIHRSISPISQLPESELKPKAPLNRNARIWSGEKAEPEPEPYQKADFSGIKAKIAEDKAQRAQKKQAQLQNTVKQFPGIQNILHQPSFFMGAMSLGAGLANPLLGAALLSGVTGLGQTDKPKQPQTHKESKPLGVLGGALNLGQNLIGGALDFGKHALKTGASVFNTVAPAIALTNPGLMAASLVAGATIPKKEATPEPKKEDSGFFGGALNLGKHLISGAAHLGNDLLKTGESTLNTVAPALSLASPALLTASLLTGAGKIAPKPEDGGLFGGVMNFGKDLFKGAKAFGEKTLEGAKHLGEDAIAGAKAIGSWVEKNKDLVKDIGHTALDLAGFIPVIGTAADLVNAGWYAAEGRYAEASASAFSAIPGIGDAFAVGKMGVKLATAAPKVMKGIKTASHLAPMAPALFQAGEAVLEGDFAKASLTAGSAFVPMLGGKAGQRLLGKAEASGSKMQAFAGNVLARGSQAMPNAIGATQVAQTYEAYQNGEASGWEVAKSVLYTAAPFAFGKGGKKPHTQEPNNTNTGKAHESNTKQGHDEPLAPTTLDRSKATHQSSEGDHSVGGLSPHQQHEALLGKALPKSARVPVQVNPKLEGNTVQVHYTKDDKGRIADVHIQAGPDATPRDIELHARTVKSMKRYSGMSFHAQKLKDRFDGWASKNGTPPVGSKAWEAKLEIQKLPDIINDRTAKLASGDLTPQQRTKLEQEVTHLEHQLDGYKKDLQVMDKDPGKGFIAAKGTPEGRILDNQQKFASELEADPKLRKELDDVGKISDGAEKIKRTGEIEKQLTAARNNRTSLNQHEIDRIMQMPGGKEWLEKFSKRDPKGLLKEGLIALELQRQGETIEAIGKPIHRTGKKSHQEATEIDIETAREIIQVKSGDYSKSKKLNGDDMDQLAATKRYAAQRANGTYKNADGSEPPIQDKSVVFHFTGEVSNELKDWLGKKGATAREGF
jgi:hypothetical protein